MSIIMIIITINHHNSYSDNDNKNNYDDDDDNKNNDDNDNNDNNDKKKKNNNNNNNSNKNDNKSSDSNDDNDTSITFFGSRVHIFFMYCNKQILCTHPIHDAPYRTSPVTAFIHITPVSVNNLYGIATIKKNQTLPLVYLQLFHVEQ